MSISEGLDRRRSSASLREVLRQLGADDTTLAAVGRCFERVVERAASLLAAAMPTLLAWQERLHSLSQEPETPGHEKLFREQLGYDPLIAKLTTRVVHYLGNVLADEINQGRRVRAIIDEIVKTKDCSTLVISRRAKRFRDECDSNGASVAIDQAAKKAGLSSNAFEFGQLIEAACERDEVACRKLGRMAALLAPHLPEKRGRPISSETCIHVMFLRFLENGGLSFAYTYSEIEGGDFVDPATRATRLALNKPGFSPLHANQVRKAHAKRVQLGFAGEQEVCRSTQGHIGPTEVALKR